MPKIILVDDEPHLLQTMKIALDSLHFSVFSFLNPAEALAVIEKEEFDLALFDLKMAPFNGIQMLEKMRETHPGTTVIIITAHGSIETAVEAIKKGAYDYIQKPFTLDEFRFMVQKVYAFHRLKQENLQLKKQLAEIQQTSPFVTQSPAMNRVIDMARKVGDSNLSVLIEGESGTGKELLASFIHQSSPRQEKIFIKINCGALPENLLESELFGHVRGAFTGAVKDRKGRFELAHEGTIFLDEVTEVSPAIQVKLLRVLQTGEFERIGESTTRRVDVRIISATNRNVEEALKSGDFREDLFYRLNAVKIKMIPLRDRQDDIPLFIEHFIQMWLKDNPVPSHPTVSPEVMKIFSTYPWPGNVRELEHVMERALLLANGGTIQVNHLPDEMHDVSRLENLHTLEEMEKQHILHVLKRVQDYEEAAKILGIDSTTLWRKRKKFNIS